jgi:leucyl/phenylalanyl-tRNA--protein transferase
MRLRSGNLPRRADRVRRPVVLSSNDFSFPPPEQAMKEPNGLLAIGGDLSPRRLLNAYAHGIFPWFSDDASPILWWSPDPRAVIFPGSLKVSRSLRRRIASCEFRVTLDNAFAEVVEGCAAPRGGDPRTWITRSIQRAYIELHRLGFAHSVESWRADELVGGLYGVSIGRMFFGESMFARATDASKVAIASLASQLSRWGFELIDCQVMNPHLRSLGAVDMPRREFLSRLRNNPTEATRRGTWRFDER